MMQSTPIISVVMPAFNAAHTIELAVDSVLRQSVQSLELIICNDGSSDHTLAILERIEDQRIRIITNASNIGAGGSRDRAIAMATAPWIALIDGDDAWHPSRLEVLLAAAEKAPGCLVFDDIMLCHETPTGMTPWRRLHGKNAYGARGSHSIVPLDRYICSDRLLIKPLIPTHAIKANEISHSARVFGEDAEFFIRLGLAGIQFSYVPIPLYYYRVTPKSLTARTADKGMMRDCIESFAGEVPTRLERAFQRKIAALKKDELLYLIRDQLDDGRLWSALWSLFARPGVLFRLLNRLPGHIYYHLHRAAHGGRAR